jgi:putative hydrolase of the HAD superfamily
MDLKSLGNKKAYIFDLFHTLTDLESKWSKLPTTSKFLGIDTHMWNEKLQFGTYDRLCGRIKDEFQIIRDLVDQIDKSISNEKIKEAIEIRKKRFGESLINIPNKNIEILNNLKRKNIKIGLISNADVMEIAYFHKSPLNNIFDSTIFSCDVGFAKPDFEIYQMSLKELKIDSKEAVFIGDGGSDELIGAKKAGLTTIMITGIIKELWPEKIPDRRKWADYEIEFLNELE